MVTTRTAHEKNEAVQALKEEADALGITVQELLEHIKKAEDGGGKPKAKKVAAKHKKGKAKKTGKGGKKKRAGTPTENQPPPKLQKRNPDYNSDDGGDDDDVSEEGVDELSVYQYDSPDEDSEEEEAKIGGKRRASSGNNGPHEPNTSVLIMELLGKGKKKEAKKKMKVAIKKIVRTWLFKFKKFIEDDTERDVAASIVLQKLNFQGLGDDEGKAWVSTYGQFVVTCLNDARGYAQSGVKKVCEKWWSGHEKTLIEEEWLEKILKRDLDMEKEDDYKVFKWWVTKVLPKCCGYAGGWDVKKYFYTSIQDAFNPKMPVDMAVTPSTEAIGAWFIECNYTAWPEQFYVKQECPSYEMVKHYIGTDKKPVSAPNSFVSMSCLP